MVVAAQVKNPLTPVSGFLEVTCPQPWTRIPHIAHQIMFPADKLSNES